MQHSLAKYAFVGVDTHKEDHTACITNCWHQILGTCRVENDPGSFSGFLNEVMSNIPKGSTPVFGLEDTDGLGRPLAQFLLQSKQIAGEVNPAKLQRKRKKLPTRINLILKMLSAFPRFWWMSYSPFPM